MSKFRICWCLASVFLLSLFAQPKAQSVFPGIPAGHWAEEAVEYLANHGYVYGTADGGFRGNADTSYYAFAVSLGELLYDYNYVKSLNFRAATVGLPTDVSPSHPAFTAVAWLLDSDIVDLLPDGSFAGSSSVTRYAAAVMLDKFVKELVGESYNTAYPLASLGSPLVPGSPVYVDLPYYHWARPSIDRLSSVGIFVGFPDRSFRGGQGLSRYQFSTAIFRMFIYSNYVLGVHQEDLDSMQSISLLTDAYSSEAMTFYTDYFEYDATAGTYSFKEGEESFWDSISGIQVNP